MINLVEQRNSLLENVLLFLPRLSVMVVCFVVPRFWWMLSKATFRGWRWQLEQKWQSSRLELEIRLLEIVCFLELIIVAIERFFTSQQNYFYKYYAMFVAVTLFAIAIIKYYPFPPNIKHYYVSMFKEDIGKTSQSLYIAEDRNSPKFGEINNDRRGQYIELNSSPIDLVWRPSRFPLNEKVTLSAEFEDAGDWDMSLVCSRCKPSKKYEWHPFYRADLRDYEIIKTFGDLNVYAKGKPEIESSAQNLKDYLAGTLQPGEPVKVLDNSYQISEIANNPTDFKEGGKVEINTKLRGSHEFFLYLKDALLLETTATIKDKAEGVLDSITLSDINGNKVAEKDFVELKPDSGSNQYVIGFDQAINQEGIYRLSFDVQDDTIIDSIGVNTNKIVVVSGVSLAEPASLYSEVEVPTKYDVSLNIRTTNETTTFKSESGNHDFDLDYRNDKVSKDLPVGSYNVNSSGNQKIIGGYFAFSKDQYFAPTIYNLSANSEPRYLISTVKMTKSRAGYNVELTFNRDEMLKVGNLNKVTLEMRNGLLEKQNTRELTLKKNGYTKIASRDGYDLWSNTDKYTTVEASNSLENLLHNILPDGAILYAEGVGDNYVQLVGSKQVSEFSTALNVIENISLRGSQQFYIYLENSLDLSVVKQDLNWYEGKDDIALRLLDMRGKSICQSVVLDDGNASNNLKAGSVEGGLKCQDINPGVYVLSIDQIVNELTQYSDFATTKISINTNRIVTKDQMLPLVPTSLFSSSSALAPLELYYWHDKKDQVLDINKGEQTFELTKEDINQRKRFTLEGGEKNLSVPVGDLYIFGGKFAFAPNEYFDQEDLIKTVREDNLPDKHVNQTSDKYEAGFQLVPNGYQAKSYLRSFNVDVQ